MARPQKKGLDYFPFDVGFFNDIKIRGLKGHFQSLDGIIVYIYFLCLIYRENGYYMQLDSDTYDVAADDLNMSSDKIGLIINFLCKRSLFDDTLFAADKVLTSRGIQLRFQEAVKSRAAKTEIEVGKYWLLSESETQSYIKRTDFHSYSEKNCGYSGKNDSFSKEKPHKVNKSKEKKNKGNYSISEGATAAIQEYEKIVGTISSHVCEAIIDWCEQVEPEVVIYAIHEADENSTDTNNKRTWRYIETVIRNHFNAGHTTLAEVTRVSDVYKHQPKAERGTCGGRSSAQGGRDENRGKQLGLPRPQRNCALLRG